MKFKERITSGISKSKDLYRNIKDKHTNSGNEEIVDHLAKTRAAEDTEKDIYTKLTEAKIITQDAYWGDAKRPIDLMATWGHARFHLVANYIVSQMPNQPIRLVKGLLLTTSAIALIVGSSVVVGKLSNLGSETVLRDRSLQAYVQNAFGTDLTTATTLSEGKRAHAKWGMFATNLNDKEGKVDFEKFAKTVADVVSGNSDAGSADLKAVSLDTSVWNEQLNAKSEPEEIDPVTLKIASADGFWNNVDAVKLLDENGVLVSSDVTKDKVAAVYKNGQLSINVIDENGNCFHVMGSSLDARCIETDLTTTELPFNSPVLISMFDAKNYTNKKSEILDPETGEVADARWYLDLPDISKIETSYTLDNINNAMTFAHLNAKFPFDTGIWKEGMKSNIVPKIADIQGFVKNPSVVKQMAETPVVAVDGRNTLIAGVVDGQLEMRMLFGDSCTTLFGTEVQNCQYNRVNSYADYLKVLYEQPAKTQLSDLTFYSKVDLTGDAAHKTADPYFKIFVSLRNDYNDFGLQPDKWDKINRSKATVVRKMAAGFLAEDSNDLIKSSDIIVLANPEKPNVIGVLSNISGALQLDVISKDRVGVDCVNVFGVESIYCKSKDITRNEDVKQFIESLF